jgi:DNA-binding response OmpR family regulator
MAPALTALLAEDDEEWRNLVVLWLSRKGFRVFCSHDGKGAIPLARECRPDVFILDFELGDTTGGKVCEEIKQLPEFKSVPVIILTACGAALPQVAASTHPPDHFVAKTGQPDELLTVLETFFPETASGQ